ncbi:hypothetical protein BD769DRAFT_1777995, partial [Suillus cothurnatus]
MASCATGSSGGGVVVKTQPSDPHADPLLRNDSLLIAQLYYQAQVLMTGQNILQGLCPLDVDQFSPMLASDTSHLLRLPDDVLAYLLDLTPMSDVESVSKVAVLTSPLQASVRVGLILSQTCRQLKAICELVRAPYLYELNQEGLEYNAASASPTVSFSQALASLRIVIPVLPLVERDVSASSSRESNAHSPHRDESRRDIFLLRFMLM